MSTPFNVRSWATQAGIETTGGFAVVAECVTLGELEKFAQIAIGAYVAEQARLRAALTETEPPALPEGYEPHELPADYTGKLWIEWQVRQLHEVNERLLRERHYLVESSQKDAATITALRAALAELEQKPVPDSKHATIAEWWAEKQRKPLTDDELYQMWVRSPVDYYMDNKDLFFAAVRLVEKAYGIKGESK